MYKKRIIIFLSIIMLMSLAIAGRLWDLQFVQGEHWIEVAENMLQDTDLLPAERGKITDRNGNILAMDKSCIELCLDYRFITLDDRTARQDEWLDRQITLWRNARLKEIRNSKGVDAAEAREIFAERQARTWEIVREMTAAGGVDLDSEIDRIKSRIRAVRDLIKMPSHLETQSHMIMLLDEMPAEDIEETVGLVFRPSTKRLYYHNSACHIVGVVGQVNDNEMSEYNISEGKADRLTRMLNNYLPGDCIGKMGVEKMCESRLRGKRGFIRYRRDGSNEELLGEQAVSGQDVRLTLDIELQNTLAEKFEELNAKGCAIVLDVPTGEILAMVSIPTYDLNLYKSDKTYYQSKVEDTANLPLLHRAISVLYPPGSSVKPMTAIAGLSSGVITPSTVFNCRGYFRDPLAEVFRCHNRNGHGPLDMYEALQKSCNIYFEEIGERLGAARLTAYFSLFGIDQKPGTGLPGEKTGILPTEEYILRRYNRHSYLPADARFMSIGQVVIEATPLHIANVMATIARNGEFYSPIITRNGGPEQVRQLLPLAPQHLAAVRKGMYMVVNEPGGTAYNKIATRTVFCGKTGTAETSINNSSMSWFAGFAPYNSPRVAFVVIIEHADDPEELQYKFKVMQTLMDKCEELGYLP